MSILRPGEFRITDKAVELSKFPDQAKVLDIGCGYGETVEHLAEKFAFKACGIDLSMPMLSEAKKRNPQLDLQYGDGEFLDGFTSYSFDGVFMECVLSMINLPDEALHEAYCVLKKGGKLILSDLYVKDAEEELIKAVAMEAERQRQKPHHEGECGDDCAEEHKKRVVDFMINGRLLKEPLLKQLEEIGYKVLAFLDFSVELDNFVAEKLMKDGSLDDCFCNVVMDSKEDRKNTGYFLVVAEKPL